MEIQSIAHNSKKVCVDALFVCITGMDADGHDFAWEAVEQGAKAIICSKAIKVEEDITVILTSDSRKALARVASAFYGFPAEKLRLIGITGTKGKTTTAYMIKQILEEAGIRTGLIGTVVVDTGKRIYESCQTTPDALALQEALAQMVEAGCEAAVMEVSSQALKLERVYGLHFAVSIFTNLTADHMGKKEHLDFDEYLHCKAKLFGMSEKAIVNMDDPHWKQVLENHTCRQIMTYGICESADYYFSDFDYVKIPGKLAVEFQIKGRYNINLVVGAVGRFTAYNTLAAVAAAEEFHIPSCCVQTALKKLVVPGRQEMFPLGYDKMIMVDYAHNGTALASLLEALRAYQPEKLTCVFGCGGERDRNRRFAMGEAAAKYADFSVITSDNPRNESPSSIISDIIKKIESFDGKYCVIEDRRQAIDFAIRNCISGEIVVIAGKGHENYQIIGERKIHFDDREEVLASIEKVKNEQDDNKRN